MATQPPDRQRLALQNLKTIEVALADARYQLTQELAGFDRLVGILLQYAQGLQGYDDQALTDRLLAVISTGELEPDDPACMPFERLEVMLRSRQGNPVASDSLPKEQRRGFPAQPALRLVDGVNQDQPGAGETESPGTPGA